jgi:hypothetical protein
VFHWETDVLLAQIGVNLSSVASVEAKIQYSQVGVSVNSIWSDLAAYTDDLGTLVDSNSHMRGSEFDLHYRLALRINDADVYYTQPQLAIDFIPAGQQPTYREVISRWNVQTKSGGYRAGYLLKKIAWGPYCPNCTDRDGKQVIKSQCATCYEVGFTPGYVQVPGCFYVSVGPSQRGEKFDTQAGSFSRAEAASQILWLNIPEVYTGDVFVDHDTDERLLIGNDIVTTVRIGGCELIRKSQAVRLGPASVVYKFPVVRTS